MDIPVKMVIALIVFIIVVGLMFLIFGAPECDSLANRTATSLKFAIDEVVEKVPEWREGVPDDITYYRTADIMLCQDKGISVLEQILGTTMEPQYRIYYEQFPEGGGGIWTEAYPWSGGAASTLRMWGYMRIASGAFKLTNAYLLSKVVRYQKFQDWLGGIAHKIRLSVFGPHLEEVGDKVAPILAKEGITDMGDTSAYYIIKEIKGAEYLFTIDEAIDEGIIKGIDGPSGRIIVSTTPEKVIIPTAFDVNGDPTEFMPFFQKTDADGNIIKLSIDTTSGGEVFDINGNFNPDWSDLKVSPTEMYKDWLDTLSKEDQEIMKQIYVTADEVPFSNIVKDKIRNTEFYKRYLQPVEERLAKFVDMIEDAEYRVSRTLIPPGSSPGTKLAFVNTLKDTTVVTLADGTVTTKGELFREMFLKQDGVADKIRLALGLTSTTKITNEHLIEAIEKIDLKGMIFLPNEMEYGIEQAAINKINSLSKIGGSYTGPSAVDAIFRDAVGYDLASNTIVDADSYKILQDYAQSTGITEIEARLKAYNFINYDVWPSYGGDIEKGKDAFHLTADTMTNYFTRDKGVPDTSLVVRWGNDEENAAKQVGLLVGTLEQNKGVMPMKPTGRLIKYFKAEAKKIIYLDGPQNILNPTSFYARAIFASLTTTGCQGNSICVYSHASMLESPMYLNEAADNYFLRSWRPVSPIAQWAGWQAALQRIPAHPRFHVVSPCFAKAKVWKTNLYGEPTIFVLPEKVDMNGTASNYCYADEGLVNTYVAIWAASDAATLITTLTGFGTVQKALKLPQEAMKLVGQVINIADPVTLAQGIAEGFVSWPGWPFQPLNYTQMVGAAGAKTIKTFTENK